MLCFSTALTQFATIFESIENSDKASCCLRGFEIKDIVRRMYSSNGYVFDDEDKRTCAESEKEIVLCKTAAGISEKWDEEPHILKKEPLER